MVIFKICSKHGECAHTFDDAHVDAICLEYTKDESEAVDRAVEQACHPEDIGERKE